MFHTLKEEFEFYVADALYGTNLNRSDLLNVFCNEYLGIAWEENEEEIMKAVVKEPFMLNDWADILQAEMDKDKI